MKAQHVNLFTVLELVLNNVHNPVYLYEKSEETGMYDKLICQKWDNYYEEHKEELLHREVYFMCIEEDHSDIYLRKEIVK